MKMPDINPNRFYTINQCLKFMEILGLPSSKIWFENKLKDKSIPKKYIVQEKPEATRYISGENILNILHSLYGV